MAISRAHLPYSVKQKIFNAIRYKPWGAQEPFHRSLATHRILAAGNQSGKTFAAAREVVCQLFVPIYDPTLGAARGRRGWVVVPRYSLADPILNEIINVLYLLDFQRVSRKANLAEGEFWYSERTHYLSIWNGAELWVKSADEPAGLHAQPLDFIVIDEAGLVPFEVYQINLVPRLTVTGGWIAAIGTFEEADVGRWFVDFFNIGQTENDQGIESFCHPTVGSPYVSQEWLEEQRKIYDPDIFAARFLAKPIVGRRLMIRNFNFVEHVSRWADYDKRYPVYLGVDPGGTYAVAALQIKYNEQTGKDVVCLFDEIYDTRGGPTPVIIQKCREKEWWPSVGLGDIVGAIDIANKESADIWIREGYPLQRRVRVNPEAGADLLCTLLHQGRFLVHPRCTNFLREVVKYKRTRRSVGRDYAAAPPSDEYNHLIKAITYFLVTKLGWRGVRPKRAFIRGKRLWPIGA